MLNVFQTCLKGFKLKKFVVVPKMAQLIELDEESVDPQLNWSSAKNFLFIPEWLFNRSRLNLNRLRSDQGLVEVQLRFGRGPVEVRSRSNGHLPRH